MRSSFYSAYASRLASWGYVCVQYDDPVLKVVDDATEVRRPRGAQEAACRL